MNEKALFIGRNDLNLVPNQNIPKYQFHTGKAAKSDLLRIMAGIFWAVKYRLM
jgi:hypothetical protein